MVFRRMHQQFGRGALVLAAAAFMLACASAPAMADDPDFLVLSGGMHDINDNRTAAEARIEYRSDIDLSVFRPFTGFMITNDSAMYGYGGVFMDLFFGRRFVVQPSFAAGAYSRGGGKNLGHWIEFRSQIEFAYRFDDRSRLGLSVSHISNASISDNNPGTESVVLTWAVPFDRIAGKNLWE
jgi:lipid A 3-O-deacylase